MSDQARRWSESYERELSGVLALQSDVARGVAGSLALALLPHERTRLGAARPVNPEAYEAYLKGLSHLYRFSRQDRDTAMEYFQLAPQKDPNYALAYTGISLVWGARAQTGQLPPHEAVPKSKAATLKALELNDTLAEAHVRLAGGLWSYEWDWPGAEREYERAIELNPNSADARVFYSFFLGTMGRPKEARTQIDRALELDPHNSFFQWALGLLLVWQRQYDEAIAQFRKALTTQPDSRDAQIFVAVALHHKGMHDEELAAMKKVAAPWTVEAVDRGYAQGGYPAAMRLAAETLAARSRETYVNPITIARYYAYAGERDRAVEWLEKAYEARVNQLTWINVAPDWDPLRSDPRFRDLLRRMNFPR